MSVAAVLERIRSARVVPVLRLKERRHAETAARWLLEAGFDVLEITLSIPDAPELIRALSAEPGLIIGAGTVATARDAEACLAAGARFIVSPWVDPELAGPCRAAGAALMPGALTPTEVRAAIKAGADAVKIFPASSAGGPAHIRALKSVFPGVLFCPTGGVAPEDVSSYLAAGAAFVGIGGALADERRIAAGDHDGILAAARIVREAA
ncbi:MAG: bifunctional 4-hydroxy-2-oxoglutarate aldolase/2-dehydro-3-deoxy-phosphogluconate aldolase [Acetobacteraceae bacterium]